MVIEFDVSVHVLTEVTGDRDKIYKAIRRTGFGDGTSLYEAVDFSLRKRLTKSKDAKRLFYSPTELIRLRSERVTKAHSGSGRIRSDDFPDLLQHFFDNTSESAAAA